jgi:Leucine-rich repeat (LRR) protein
LQLSDNNLTTLNGDAFKGMENLKYLFLDVNKFSTVNLEIFKYFKSSYFLNLNGNGIKSLDLKFYQVLPETLKQLWISYNEITEVPVNAFNNSSNLYDLVLANNLLKSFMISHSYLQNLVLHRNQISELNLGSSSTITSLFIDRNSLTVLSSAMFSNILNLREFSFQNNSIEAIDKNLMEKFKYLKYYKERFLNNPCVKSRKSSEGINMEICFKNYEKI